MGTVQTQIVQTQAPPPRPSPEEMAILEAVRSLEFGSVEVTIHEGRVVQIECRKKIRFQP
jgi:hypothetical protein